MRSPLRRNTSRCSAGLLLFGGVHLFSLFSTPLAGLPLPGCMRLIDLFCSGTTTVAHSALSSPNVGSDYEEQQLSTSCAICASSTSTRRTFFASSDRNSGKMSNAETHFLPFQSLKIDCTLLFCYNPAHACAGIRLHSQRRRGSGPSRRSVSSVWRQLLTAPL